MRIIKQSQKSINEAINVLKEGGVVICPTDTVYGFLADAANKKTVEKIYKIKRRPRAKPLPVFVKDIKMAKGLAEIDKNQEKFLINKWPGKYTFVLNRKNKKGTIALRIPKYKFLNNLLRKINKPLVQTSVNISSQPALISAKKIIKQFENQNILFIDGGNLPKHKPSAIIDLSSDKIKFLRK